ncbi:type IV pilin [Halorhabdus salina]|uniref:type IV pilin n=1 Tax=Halorhabdus salina TaxID=2750670 RepID=UPI0015EF1E0C|nr:type IV pilin [Halorhabdus salina]
MQSSVRLPNKRGVISILGILLLIVGAIFGTFVMEMGASQGEASVPPQAVFGFESDDSGAVVITHEGGDMVPRSALEVRSPGTVSEWPDDEIAAGDSITVTELESGDAIRVVWESPDGEKASVLATYDVP